MLNPMSNAPLLQVDGVSKLFPITAGIFKGVVGHIRALEDIHLTLFRGEVVGIVGESGCGKSTLARVIMRLIEATKGVVHFDGDEWSTLPLKKMHEKRRKMQMVFQDPYASLNPRKTILETLGEPLRYHGLVKNQNDETDRVALLLEKIGLSSDTMWRYPHQLSGGQQQRICIGRAISLDPELVICDEAVSALDVSVQAQVLNLLISLKKELGLSYLFISHDLTVVRYISDKVLVLYLGKVMESASTKELFRNPKHPYTRALLSAVPRKHPLEEPTRMLLHGEIPSARNPPSGCPFRTRCPYAKPICAEEPPRRTVVDPDTGRDDHVYHCIL